MIGACFQNIILIGAIVLMYFCFEPIHDNETLIKECEKELPRNQKCKIAAVVKESE